MFELVRDVNAAIDANGLSADDAQRVRDAFDRFDDVLGVIALRRLEDAAPPVDIEEIERLIGNRKEARRNRDFAAADAIRDDLESRGVILEDSPSGTHWKRK